MLYKQPNYGTYAGDSNGRTCRSPLVVDGLSSDLYEMIVRSRNN